MRDHRPKTSLEEAEVTGPVKQVMETRYKAQRKAGVVVQGKIETGYPTNRFNSVITFSEAGTKVKEELYGTDGHIIKTFNDKEQEVESLQYMKGKFYQKTVNTYNEKGHRVEHLTTNADGTVFSRSTHKYNEFDREVEHVHSMGNPEKVFSRRVTTFDDKVWTKNGIRYQNVLSSIEYDGDGNVKRRYINTYDERGNNIESLSENTDKNAQKYNSRSTKKYNEHNDCIEMTYYNADGSVKNHHTFSYEYDSEGKRIIPENNTVTVYEDNDIEERPLTDKRENDDRGNWIKKTTYSNDIPVNIFLRQIIYFDSQASAPLVHPITLAPKEEIEEKKDELRNLTAEESKWLVESPNATADNFSTLRYYMLLYKEPPSVVVYTGPHIEALALLHELKENMNAQMVHSYSTVWNSYRSRLVRYTLNFPRTGYMLHATHIQPSDAEEFTVPDFMEENPISQGDDKVHLSQFSLLCPAEESPSYDEYFIEQLDEYIDKCSLQKKPDKPTIYMIEVSGNNFSMEEHPINDNFEIRDLDVHYGYGFEKFHNDLMARFSNETKGLILFHGLPGTGKTFYIRHLLRKMVSANRKVVIYMPPNMVDHLVEPAFMTFLMGEVQRWSDEGFFSVLLIEDAEPLLAKRVEGVRIQGVTNLLNMSDGLLNDMLNLQIICTFNVDVKKLDSALLRPGRLIARKEFKPLSVLDANLLASRLGIKHHFEEPTTLSEIYAMRKNKNTLIHDVEPDRDASSIIDDLI